MTERSRPWDGVATGDATESPYDAATEWARLFRAFGGAESTANKGGVLMGATGGDYAASTPSANTARIGAGIGWVQGTWHESDANVDITIPTPSTSTRVDRVVLRKAWAAQTVRIVRIAGTEGAGAPAMTQTIGTTWDVPLWNVTITTGGAITFQDQRIGMGHGSPTISNPTFTGTITAPAGSLTNAVLANRTRSEFIPATAFVSVTGSPSFSTTGNGAGCWLLDPATTEEVACGWMLPMDANGSQNIDIYVYIAPVVGGGVGVREIDIEINSSVLSAGVVVGGGGSTDTFTTEAASGAVNAYLHGRHPTLTPGQAVMFAVARKGANATDDLSADIRFFGVRIDYAADS